MTEGPLPFKLCDSIGAWPNLSLFKPWLPNCNFLFACFFNNQSGLDKRTDLMMNLPCFQPLLGSPVLSRQLHPSPWPTCPAALAPETSSCLSLMKPLELSHHHSGHCPFLPQGFCISCD